jgi:hypothetical protein
MFESWDEFIEDDSAFSVVDALSTGSIDSRRALPALGMQKWNSQHIN